MALDYSKLSDEELEAISNNDYSKLSSETLNAIANEGAEQTPAGTPATKEPGWGTKLAGGAITAGQVAGQAVSSIPGAQYVVPGATAYGAYRAVKDIPRVTSAVKTLFNPSVGMGGFNPITSTSGTAGQQAFSQMGSQLSGTKIPINQPIPPSAPAPTAAPQPATAAGRAYSPQAQQWMAQRAEQAATQQAFTNPSAGNFIQRMSALAKQYGPTAARFGVGLGALSYSKGLNTGEDEELARRRAMGPTITP